MARRTPGTQAWPRHPSTPHDRASARFDALVLGSCAALFFLVSYAIKPLGLLGATGAFVDGHLVDIIGGCAFCAYVNLLLDVIHPTARLRRWWQCAVLMVPCGLFWEYAAPILVRPSVSDPLDLMSYVAGSMAYAAVLAISDRVT